MLVKYKYGDYLKCKQKHIHVATHFTATYEKLVLYSNFNKRPTDIKLHVKLSSVAIEIKSCFVNEKIVNFGVFVVVTMSKVCVVYGELGVRFI